jgi:hypothetical protein
MRANRSHGIAGREGVLDYASLYLCRQGHTWVVVMESPLIAGVLCFHRGSPDSLDVPFKLLSTARRACPEATILSLDGAFEGADYELLLCVRGAVAHTGDIGTALHRALADDESPRRGRRGRRRGGRRTWHSSQWGRRPGVSDRPLAF